jgi:mono/diheme cytochrome c family protein
MKPWMKFATLSLLIMVVVGCSKEEAATAPTSTPAASVTTSSTPTPSAAAAPTASAAASAAVSATPAPSAAASSSPSSAATTTPVGTAAPTATPTPKATETAAPKPSASAASSAMPSAEASVDAVKAEAIYKDNCLSCHGKTLEGEFGPNISKVGAKRSKDELIAKINNGGSRMPEFKDTLKKEEVETLALWLASKK